jgi:hypothetical protein
MMGKGIYRMGTMALSLSMAVIGLILIVQELSGTSNAGVVRLVLGVLFVVAGGGRLYLLARRRGGA